MRKITNALLAVVLLLTCYSTKSTAQALNFGAYSYVDLGGDIIPNNQSYTKEAWIRIYYYSTQHGCNILSAWDHPFWLENGVLSAANNYGPTSETTVIDPAGKLALNTWIHVAVTYDAATSTMKLYKNGVLIATNTDAPAYITSGLQIGAQEYGDFFDGGDIDEVRLWDVARTQSQIQANMNCDVAQNTNLVAYYRFNDGLVGLTNGGTTYDYSGNAHCGTLYNFNLVGLTANYILGAISTSCNSISVVTSAPAAISGSSSVCQGSSIQLSNSVAGGVWTVDEVDTADISDAGLLTGSYPGSVTVNYKTCGGSVSKTITVNESPVIAATASNGKIEASATEGISPYSYKWSNGSTSAIVSNLSTGTYSVTVTDAKGCKDTGSYYVTGSVILTNAITVTPSSNCYTGGNKNVIYLGYGSQSVKFTAKATGASYFSYKWTPGTYLSSTTNQSVTFTPTKAGTFTYTCTATSNGKSVSATVTMVVIDVVDRKHYGCVYVSHSSPCNKGRQDTKSVKCKDVPKQLCYNKKDRLGACGSNKSVTETGNTKGMIIVGNEISVSTFPNPFTEGINVKVDGGAEFADVVVYDLTGKIVEVKENQSVNSAITVGSTLTNGMYIVEVKSGDQSQKLRIVKSK